MSSEEILEKDDKTLLCYQLRPSESLLLIEIPNNKNINVFNIFKTLKNPPNVFGGYVKFRGIVKQLQMYRYSHHFQL